MRVETTSRTLYQYSELNDKAKQVAREWLSRTEDEWFNATATDLYDDFSAVAKCLGVTFDRRVRQCPANQPGGARANNPITDPCIWWTGFSSQGDGACFEGVYAYAENAPAQISENGHGQDKTLHAIADGLAELQAKYDHTLSATVKHAGHYYHKYSTQIDWTAQTADGNADRDVTEDDQKAGTELLRDFMQWIYNTLETEYKYLTGNKYAEERLSEGEYEFTETGKIA